MTAWNTRAAKTLTQRLKQQWEEQNLPCWLCNQLINYQAAPHTPDACEPDHVLPRQSHPELALDPDNLRPAHCSCNRARGNKQPPPQLGQPSRNWFL